MLRTIRLVATGLALVTTVCACRPASSITAREEQRLAANVAAQQAHQQGENAYAAGDFKDALRGFETAFRLEPRSSLALLNICLAQSRLGRSAEALETVREVLNRQPQWEVAWVRAAHLYADANRLPEAEEAARKATELAARFPEAWLARAHVALLQDHPADSEKHARRATALSPQSVAAWLALGDALLRLPNKQRLPEAVKAFEKAVALEPNAYTQRRLGEALREAGQLEPAIRALRAAAKAEPSDPTHAYHLSLALREAGKTQEADEWAGRSKKLQEERYRRVALSRKVEQSPGDARLQQELARELRRQGDRSGAMRAYRQVLALDPENRAARKSLAELEAGVAK